MCSFSALYVCVCVSVSRAGKSMLKRCWLPCASARSDDARCWRFTWICFGLAIHFIASAYRRRPFLVSVSIYHLAKLPPLRLTADFTEPQTQQYNNSFPRNGATLKNVLRASSARFVGANECHRIHCVIKVFVSISFSLPVNQHSFIPWISWH